MKYLNIAVLLFVVAGCSQEELEEVAFRKTLEYNLTELCGEDSDECIAAVKAQIKGCMEKSNWRKFLNDQDNEKELKRFSSEFYSCIVDSEGNPYFESNL